MSKAILRHVFVKLATTSTEGFLQSIRVILWCSLVSNLSKQWAATWWPLSHTPSLQRRVFWRPYSITAKIIPMAYWIFICGNKQRKCDFSFVNFRRKQLYSDFHCVWATFVKAAVYCTTLEVDFITRGIKYSLYRCILETIKPYCWNDS